MASFLKGDLLSGEFFYGPLREPDGTPLEFNLTGISAEVPGVEGETFAESVDRQTDGFTQLPEGVTQFGDSIAEAVDQRINVNIPGPGDVVGAVAGLMVILFLLLAGLMLARGAGEGLTS